MLLIMISSLFVERIFCRYFCPLGGVFSIISKLRLYRIKKNSSKCLNCNLCAKKCPMSIDVNNEINAYKSVKSGECIDCFKCIDSCNNKVLYTNPKEAISVTVATVAIAGIYYAGTLTTNTNVSYDNLSNTLISKGKYTDGVYEGTGQGYRDTIKVKVTVSNGNIASITIESYEDDESVYINMDFLGLDLSKVPMQNLSDIKVLIIPIIYVITTFVNIKLITNMNKTKFRKYFIHK